jgi:alpha-amylase/alpha-mannosidase (GH57 family)
MSGEQQPLQVVLCWHMHQPDYRGPDHSDFQLPWVYLHGIKDYVDMAAHLENIQGARAVVNFSPVLLEQIDEYVEQIEEWLQHGVRIKDPLLAALAGPGLPLEQSLRHDLMRSCLRANEKRLVKRFPAYKLLADIALWVDKHEESLLYLNDQYLIDLMVWYHLAWMGEFPRNNDLRLHSLEKKGSNYTVEDRRQLVTTIGELLSSIVPRYRRLAEEDKVELSVTPYAHPIVPLLIDMQSAREAMPDIELPLARYYSGGEARSRWHIRRGIESFKKYFSMAPAGCWPSEGAVTSETMRIIEEEGFRWVASGQQVLVNSLNLSLDGKELPANCVHTPYRVGKGDINCFFRDDGLSDFIGFTYADWHADDAVGDFINHLEIVADASVNHPDRVVSIIMDGENAWESYPKNGSYFLSALYKRIVDHPRLELTTFSDCLAKQQKSAPVLEELVAGSWVYGTFSTWIGDRDKNRAWDMLADAKLVFDRVMASGSLDEARIEEASMQLANCEGSDWFWWFGDYNPGGTVSDFERLFRHQLTNLYKVLGEEPPEYLSRVFAYGAGDPAMGGVMRQNN